MDQSLFWLLLEDRGFQAFLHTKSSLIKRMIKLAKIPVKETSRYVRTSKICQEILLVYLDKIFQDLIKIYHEMLVFQVLVKMIQILQEMSTSCMSYQVV